MNLKTLRQWELRLGITHVVVLLGLVTGSMACAFYFGFFTGQDAGFERAYAAGIASVPRLPIAMSELPPGSADDAVSEVYARLHDDSAKEAASATGLGDDQTRLGASDELVDIRPLGSAPLPEEDVPFESASALDSEQAAKRGKSAEKITIGAAIGKEQTAASSGPTLGGLVGSNESRGTAPMIQVRNNEIVKNTPSDAPASKSAGTKPSAADQSQADRAEAEKSQAAKLVQKDTSLIRAVLPKGWFAQVAAPSKRADAEGMAKRLKGSGFPVVIENANVRGQEYYRVLVGPEDSRTQGELLVTQLKRERYIDGDPFLRLVK